LDFCSKPMLADIDSSLGPPLFGTSFAKFSNREGSRLGTMRPARDRQGMAKPG
jgi:hypothetical protein